MLNDNKSSIYEVELQVPYRVCAEVPKESILWREAIGKILRQLCEWKGVEIVEAEIRPDHAHMLVSIPPKVAVSSFMGYLKGKSSLMICEQFGNLKYKYKGREFWCRGYYVDTVGKDDDPLRVASKREARSNGR